MFLDLSELANTAKTKKYSWSYPVFELRRTLAGTNKMFLDLKRDPQFRRHKKCS